MPQPDENGNEPTDEVKNQVQKKIDEAMKINAEIEKVNEEI